MKFLPKQMLDEVDEFSGKTLKRRDDLFSLFQNTAEHSFENKLEEVSFTAKYVNGLMRVLKSGNQNPEVGSLDHVKKDLSSNLEKVKEQLKELIGKDELLKIRFETEYFALNQNAFSALTELLYDLEWTKKYLNHQKRSKNN